MGLYFFRYKNKNLIERLKNNFKSRPLLKNGNLKENLENMIKKEFKIMNKHI